MPATVGGMAPSYGSCAGIAVCLQERAMPATVGGMAPSYGSCAGTAVCL
jgi:hypothetical protein